MESHFSSIHLHGSSEPAFRRQRAPAPGRFVQSFAQQRNPLLSMSFPLDSPLHLVNTIMLPIQTMETSEQGVQQYSICPPKANVLPELTRLLQLVKSHRMDLLHAQSCKPTSLNDSVLHGHAIRSQTSALHPSLVSTKVFPSTVLQSQHIKWSLSFFFSGQITQAYFYKCPITQMLCTINQSLLALWLFKFPCKLQMGNSVCSYFHKPVLSFQAVLQGNSYSTGISVAAVIAHKGICGTLQPAPLLSSVINSWKAIEGACSEHC